MQLFIVHSWYGGYRVGQPGRWPCPIPCHPCALLPQAVNALWELLTSFYAQRGLPVPSRKGGKGFEGGKGFKGFKGFKGKGKGNGIEAFSIASTVRPWGPAEGTARPTCYPYPYLPIHRTSSQRWAPGSSLGFLA